MRHKSKSQTNLCPTGVSASKMNDESLLYEILSLRLGGRRSWESFLRHKSSLFAHARSSLYYIVIATICSAFIRTRVNIYAGYDLMIKSLSEDTISWAYAKNGQNFRAQLWQGEVVNERHMPSPSLIMHEIAFHLTLTKISSSPSMVDDIGGECGAVP